ncbi:hypothetical protein K443DRAFT_465178 [Laccaria amethystina LaAM-08-1]|uniref:Uncharacterized protein n=1 Tax=Laccaria amethystina LaAM-08-1 TaxID=1095629 RepID=A0A0C9XFI4_9AGAR|nr:hypothetical protein K443DRAFT_465178 [Laccaria amethystina LaAM-08-1]
MPACKLNQIRQNASQPREERDSQPRLPLAPSGTRQAKKCPLFVIIASQNDNLLPVPLILVRTP